MGIRKTDENTGKTTRRKFLKAGSMAFAGMAMPARRSLASVSEPLAIAGGSQAVSVPTERIESLIRWPRYGDNEKRALHDLIDKATLANNEFYAEAPALETEWKAYMGAPHAKAHMNGSSAITSMFFALDLPPGSEILVTSWNHFSDCLTERFFCYVPVFVDVDPHTACFDLDDAKRKLSKNTRALFPMHCFGLPCEMDHIMGFAKEKGLLVIEDAAHAHGASMQGKNVGNWGVMGIFSFQVSKVMPAVEGGMGVYSTREYYERAAAFGHFEDPVKFPVESPVHAYAGTGFGQKYRMHPFGAVVARQQLRVLDEQHAMVEANVRKLNDRLLQLPGLSEQRLRKDQKRAYYEGNLLLLDPGKAGFSRDALLKALRAEGVRAFVWHFPQNHKFKIYSEAKWWHHPPPIAPAFPGNDEVDNNHIFVSHLYAQADDVIDQYVKAFEKVWAHKADVAKL
jgi:perosamine synthetase